MAIEREMSRLLGRGGGEHRVRYHAEALLEVSVLILAQETDISTRRTIEALWIAALSPRVNRKGSTWL